MSDISKLNYIHQIVQILFRLSATQLAVLLNELRYEHGPAGKVYSVEELTGDYNKRRPGDR